MRLTRSTLKGYNAVQDLKKLLFCTEPVTDRVRHIHKILDIVWENRVFLRRYPIFTRVLHHKIKTFEIELKYRQGNIDDLKTLLKVMKKF